MAVVAPAPPPMPMPPMSWVAAVASSTGPVFHWPVWLPASCSICSAYWASPRISSALWNRSSGSLARERMTSPSSSGGTDGCTCDGGTGVSWTCW